MHLKSKLSSSSNASQMAIVHASKNLLISRSLLILVLALFGLRLSTAAAQEATPAAASGEAITSPSMGVSGALPLQVRTESPRETLASFVRLRDALEDALPDYWQDSSRENAKRLALIADQMRTLYDFSQIAAASRKDLGSETAAYVMDILGRITLPHLDEVPDLAAVELEKLNYYAIPETPLRIIRMDSGPRTGEFLFSAQTVQTAPWFYQGIGRLPLDSPLPIASWVETNRQLTGPMIPAALVAAVPAGLKHPLFGTPAWKVIVVIAAILAAAALLAILRRVVRPRDEASPRVALWRRLAEPLALAAFTSAIQAFSVGQINVSGEFALGLETALDAVLYLALAWAVWRSVVGVFEMLIVQRDGYSNDIDANLLRLLARIIGAVFVIIILASGAQAVGVPVISVLAGLGVGGLAVALAIRPTLENLIGGMILYLDKPIRVGDFCRFGAQDGTVESIGVRSTLIRARDRTLISIPNAQFADMPIVNWTQCDQMLMQETIGLRYETGADQLREVLDNIREMFCSDSRIDPKTVRIRFAGYGSSSLDISIRVYVKTRDWSDFLSIKEDFLFRIKDIVERSGTGFAFPSQTVYLHRDADRDVARSDRANTDAASSRRSGRRPLRRFAGGIESPPEFPDDQGTQEELASRGERLPNESLEQEAEGDDRTPMRISKEDL